MNPHSTAAIVTTTGTLLESHSYDPFGRPREGGFRNHWDGPLKKSVLDSDVTDRGYTGHEQLDESQYTHMNGRLYDFNLGRFLSVDPFVQSPGNTQSANPYSYIMNNPLSGVDPTGYISMGIGESGRCMTMKCFVGSLLKGLTFAGGNGTWDGASKLEQREERLTSTIGGAASRKGIETSYRGGYTDKYLANLKKDMAVAGAAIIPYEITPMDYQMACNTAECNSDMLKVQKSSENGVNDENIEFQMMTQEERLFYLFKYKMASPEDFQQATTSLTKIDDKNQIALLREALPKLSKKYSIDTIFKLKANNELLEIMLPDYRVAAFNGVGEVAQDAISILTAKGATRKVSEFLLYKLKKVAQPKQKYKPLDIIRFYGRQNDLKEK